ncbi:unnamed protein product [Rotaria magnacalcarata]|uniref:Uncharacterized protein n=1 Tax=Rotaria magnacalcarata TaxID=392030 RepID=A0A816HBU1_9BILA|nr:unnamed protein product [Rotaria magnacalcarata]
MIRFKIDNDALIAKLVDVFKYQAGLLNELGHNSFRFIHRTFQEYLAGKSIVYSYGTERSENEIYQNINIKIGIPDWRVPLCMTFEILSKSAQRSTLFKNIITKLLHDEQVSSNRESSTLIVPFVIIDSLNDLYFSSKDTEYELIRKLADMLLLDYRNLSGFSRLKQHQELIHSYIMYLTRLNSQMKCNEFFTFAQNQPELIKAARSAEKYSYCVEQNVRGHLQKLLDGIEVLPHPTYSPDLAPSDYGLFRSMVHFFRGRRFETFDQVEAVCRELFESKEPHWYRDQIRQLAERWRKVIENDGLYFEE